MTGENTMAEEEKKALDEILLDIENAMSDRFKAFLTINYVRSLACVYTYFYKINPSKAVESLDFVSEPIKSKILEWAGKMDYKDPEVIAENAHVLDFMKFDDKEVLKLVKRAGESLLSSEYEEFLVNYMDHNPLLAIILKDSTFFFNDIKKLNRKDVQKIVESCDKQLLKTALVGADEELRNIFFNAVSHRAAVIMKEDIEYFERKLAGKKYIVAKAQWEVCSFIINSISSGLIEMPYNYGEIL